MSQTPSPLKYSPGTGTVGKDRKRKRDSDIATKNTILVTPPNKQQITPPVLANTSNRSNCESPDVKSATSPHKDKRHKIFHQPDLTQAKKKVQPLTTNQMHSFPTSSSSTPMIDLTASSKDPIKTRMTLRPGQAPKKLVVKNLASTQPQFNAEEYFEKTWVKIDKVLSDIFANRTASLGTEDLYRSVEGLCRLGQAKQVYNRLDKRCKDYLQQKMQKWINSDVFANPEDKDVLIEFIAAWNEWKSQVMFIRQIFFFMDRSYLLSQSKTNLNDVCIAYFRDIMFMNENVKSKVVDGVCEIISTVREGTAKEDDKSLLKDAIDLFHQLVVYTSVFEPKLLGKTQSYVISWKDDAFLKKTLTEYVNDTTVLISQEIERGASFGLDKSTLKDILVLLEDHLIQFQAEFLAEDDAVASILEVDDRFTLANLYNLLDRKRLCEKLKNPFAKWVQDTGTKIIFDDKNQDDMIIRLLSLKTKLDSIWSTEFKRNVEISHGMRSAFETFMNKTKKGDATWGTDNSKTGEMIAKYVDLLLRGGSRAIPSRLTSSTTKQTDDQDVGGDEDEKDVDEDLLINRQLDQVLDLFRFIHGKAVFEAFYKKDLAKRLLMGRSASADAERSMLTRLKTECGAGFTQNLEQMFKDVELGREEVAAYKDRLDHISEKPGDIDLSVNVLSASAWPSYPDIPVTIPADVNLAVQYFEDYYKVKHSGRKLAWKHALAHCQLKAKFPSGTKEFVMSSFQAIILLLFNDIPGDQRLSYEHIKSATGLPEAEVKRTLQSLACAKLRPLTKFPVGKEIESTDEFSVNLAFTHPRYRVRVNQVQLKETKQENKETHERVAEDRNFECQAAVVRIMKGRKTISHGELIAEVINATKSRGVLSVGDIKKNIDRLIEKDYMERGEGNMYKYVA